MVTRRRSHTNSDELEIEMKQDTVCQEVQSVRFQATATLATSLDWMKSKKAEANASAWLRRREIQARGRGIEGHLSRRPRTAK